jgi:hypothetical protein
VTVKVLSGNVIVGVTTTMGDGSYFFLNLPPATYRVVETQPAWILYSTTPNEVTTNVFAGQQTTVNFGDWDGLAIYVPLLLR